MNAWRPRRFWTSVDVAREGAGYAVLLDGRPARTPAKARLAMPTHSLAAAIAEEWRDQGETVDPESMPMTRTANAAIDKVAPCPSEVAGMLAGYADSDLACYRAGDPAELAARQSAAWNPLLDWASERYGARLIVVEGVMHRPQPKEALARLAAALNALQPFELAAMHELAALSGSLIIGLAAAGRHLDAEELWRRSRIDEDWQIEQWGHDEEAAAQAEEKRRAFLHAARFLDLARNRP